MREAFYIKLTVQLVHNTTDSLGDGATSAGYILVHYGESASRWRNKSIYMKR
jgi:hypothetical protein